jgi:hypothetical protein
MKGAIKKAEDLVASMGKVWSCSFCPDVEVPKGQDLCLFNSLIAVS